jgi:formylglycine-generating enzyme required for sulfatase activity
MKDEIFLSYARSDKKRAHIFAEALEQQGYSVWWDPKILGGSRFDEVVQEKLNAAKCVIVLWSKHSVKSDWVKDEAGSDKRKIVPVFIDDVKIPLGFRQIHALNFIDWMGTLPYPEFDLLLESVTEMVGRPISIAEQKKEPEVTKKSGEEEEPKKTFTNSIGMKFVLIPAGEFMMGSNEYDSEKPVHNVTISKPFYLGVYPVTQREWKAVIGDNPSGFKGDDLPVENISWHDAQEFINKLNEKEEISKYRLPSEAEWEYAARAGTTTRYSFGDDESKIGEYAWYWENSGNKTHPVGQKQSNPWGLYDMHGNVWEWVQDKYHNGYDGAPIDGSAWEDGGGADRVFRGGGWDCTAELCRSAFRFFNDPGDLDLGFRLLQEL